MLDSLLLSSSQRASLTEAAHRYHANVLAAAFYLDGRGVAESQASSFLLGCVGDPITGHERFRGMLSIPYLCHGSVVAMKFRRIEDSDGPKYDAPAGQHLRLYNAQSLAEGGEVAVVCEGELDAIAAAGALSVPSVGVPGTSAWDANPHWARCFGDFDRVVVIADNDVKESGDNPGMKLAQKIVKSVGGAELVAPPAGLDLTDWLLRDGADAVRKAVGV